MPQTYTTNQSILYIPENVKKIEFTLLGAGGGGEYVNRITGNASPGSSGGDTTFLGMTAGGGRGGGIGGRNQSGTGGVATTGIYDFRPSALVDNQSVVTLVNGQDGTLWYGGAGSSVNTILSRRDGGDGTSDQVTYTSTVSHSFVNAPPYYAGQIDNSPDITVTVMNPSTIDAPCGVYSWTRYYLIRFNFPFDDNGYEAFITSPFPSSTAAGGNFTGYASFDKKTDTLGVWWCKYRVSGSGTVNSYVNQFGIAIRTNQRTGRGTRSSLRGRGGGGGSEITGVLGRADLLSRGLLDFTTSLVIGTAGRDSSDPNVGPVAYDGDAGAASVYIEYETRTYINVKNNPNNTIIQGQSATIEWEVTGDADWALVEPGISAQTYGGSNFKSETTVTPSSTTTYFVRADGQIGGFSESSVVLTVLQPPSITATGPVDVNYGNNVIISYEVTNAVTSLTLRPVFYFVDGTTLEDPQYNVSLEIGELVDSSIEYDLTPWGDKGPSSIEFNFDAVGYSYQINAGQPNESTVYLEQSYTLPVSVKIDTKPEFFQVPDSDDVLKDQDPVISPKRESSITLLVTDIDIPVQVKADLPVQVEIDNNLIWRDVERIEDA